MHSSLFSVRCKFLSTLESSTSAPARLSTSTTVTVSISSEPSLTRTKTFAVFRVVNVLDYALSILEKSLINLIMETNIRPDLRQSVKDRLKLIDLDGAITDLYK